MQPKWTARILDTKFNFYVRSKVFTLGGGGNGACTGFVVTPDGYIATAGHCVIPQDDKYKIDTRLELMDVAFAWAVKNNVYGDNVDTDALADHALNHWKLVSPTSDTGSRIKYPLLDVDVSWGANVSGIEESDGLSARVLGRSSFGNGDVALLKVNATDLNALPLAKGAAETGSELQSIGYPGKVDAVVDDDYTPSIKPGTISSSKTVSGGKTPVYEISAAVAGGMSGGPTINSSGEAIGVNSFGYKDSEAFNFVRPIELVKEMLGQAGVKASLSDTSKTYFKGLDAYFDGDKKVAVDSLTKVVDEQPANGMAKDYLKKAKALPTPPPPPDEGVSSTLLLIGGAALLLLLLLGGLAFLLLRRRSRPSPMPEAPAFAPVPGGQPAGTAPGGPAQSAYPQGQPETKVPTPRTPDEARAPTGHPVETTEIRPTAPAGFAPTSNGAVGPSAPRSSASQPGAVTTPGPAITSVSAPSRAGEHHFCTQCGSKVAAGGKFCGECGHRV